MAKLRSFVHVSDETGLSHVFGPNDVVPDWAVVKIVNPKAWEVAPVAAPEPTVAVEPKKPARKPRKTEAPAA